MVTLPSLLRPCYPCRCYTALMRWSHKSQWDALSLSLSLSAVDLVCQTRQINAPWVQGQLEQREHCVSLGAGPCVLPAGLAVPSLSVNQTLQGRSPECGHMAWTHGQYATEWFTRVRYSDSKLFWLFTVTWDSKLHTPPIVLLCNNVDFGI